MLAALFALLLLLLVDGFMCDWDDDVTETVADVIGDVTAGRAALSPVQSIFPSTSSLHQSSSSARFGSDRAL